MGKAENFKIDMNDDVIGRAMVVYDGQINWPQKPLNVSAKPILKNAVAPIVAAPENKTKSTAIILLALTVLLFLIGRVAPPEFLSHFTVFVLACFIGWQVVWNVSHSLHTPCYKCHFWNYCYWWDFTYPK
jgi:NAD(P) transhydrogenase subunit alpha